MTEIDLRTHLERLIEELDRRIDQRFIMSDCFNDKRELALKERLHAMNEIRDAMKDQASQMATRHEVGLIVEQVQELRRLKANLDGRMAVISGLISLIVTALVLWISHGLK